MVGGQRFQLRFQLCMAGVLSGYRSWVGWAAAQTYGLSITSNPASGDGPEVAELPRAVLCGSALDLVSASSSGIVSPYGTEPAGMSGWARSTGLGGDISIFRVGANGMLERDFVRCTCASLTAPTAVVPINMPGPPCCSGNSSDTVRSSWLQGPLTRDHWPRFRLHATARCRYYVHQVGAAALLRGRTGGRRCTGA